MEERIERLKFVAQEGSIDDFYMLIGEDVKLLEHIEELPFVDTPLHIAASAGHIPFALEIMRLKPSFARKPNRNGKSPIHLALENGKTELVCWLLHIDRDLVRVKGREGITPLHYVAKTNDHVDLLAKFLLLCPSCIEDVTFRNESALHIALKCNNLEAFRVLVGWIDSFYSKNASFYGRAILNWKDEEGNTLLHIAVSKNQTQARYLYFLNYEILN
jgi:ankyrin repeat protein